MESLQTIEEKEIAPPTYEVLLLNLITQFVNRSVPLEVERLFFPAEQISSVEDGHLNGLSLLGNAGCSPEKILTSSPQRQEER